MIINVGDKIEDTKGRVGEITNIGIATEKTDIAAELPTSINAQTYDTLLNYTGAIMIKVKRNFREAEREHFFF